MGTKWEVDILNSYVGFELSYLKISKLIGNFTVFSGCITLADTIKNRLSNLVLTAHTSSIDTRNASRDSVLKSSNCLSAIEFPETKFKSSKFLPIDNSHFLINGTLNLKDDVKEIQFTAYMGGIAFDEMNHQRLCLELTASISREDFKLENNFLTADKEDCISDQVGVHLHLQFLNTSENHGT